ncbi:MAG: T9SS type A sorting domain-containing protein [Candidatus Cloacimonetes bacterium]|nr:T9SS type A sorting domain-containing protein [Candidatus Cloacimonadota bacterium]
MKLGSGSNLAPYFISLNITVRMEKLNKKASIILVVYLVFLALVSNLEARIINFAGREWIVKSGYGGPGPNYWSDSEENVWIDDNGWLHLKIRNEYGTWYCSEVYTNGFTQYGMHRFYIISRLDSLDKNVVFAPFLYKDDTTEVDIEFAKWGLDNPSFNAQYVVQPWYHPGNLERFLIQLNGTYTTHYMDWYSSLIEFKSIHGHYEQPPNPDYLIHEWLYTGNDIPQKEESLRVHINLWLYQGNPPSNSEEVEVIIKDADLPEIIGISEDYSDVLDSKAFHLSQNYPNPFNTKTYINYSLPKSSNVNIQIYNLKGQLVKTLVDENKPAGYHTVEWNVPEKSEMSSGIYFYKLSTKDKTLIKKMILLR